MNNMANRLAVRDLTMTAMLIACTVVISRVFIIPVPLTHGNVNLSDAGIFIGALCLGPRKGGVIGALSGFLLDLISGYAQYMFFSLIIHGLEGVITGWLFQKRTSLKAKIFSVIAGGLLMVLGYFIADSLLYSRATGLIGVPTNLFQGFIGGLVAIPIVPVIDKVRRRVDHVGLDH